MVFMQPVERPKSLTELAYTRLREALLEGVFNPGTAFSIVRLAESLDMSRSPVRSAVERIVSEGLLEQTDSGFRVRHPNKEELMAALQVRAPLEGLAAELACPTMREDDLEELQKLHQQFATAAAIDDSKNALKADLAFHQRVHKRLTNTVLVDYLERVQGQVVLGAYAGAWEGSQKAAIQEHISILDALKAKDAKRAGQAAANHINAVRERVHENWAPIPPASRNL